MWVHFRYRPSDIFPNIKCFFAISSGKIHEETIGVTVNHLCSPGPFGMDDLNSLPVIEVIMQYLFQCLSTCLDNAVRNLRAWHAAREGGRGIPVGDICNVFQGQLAIVLKFSESVIGASSRHASLHHDPGIQDLGKHLCKQGSSYCWLHKHETVGRN